MPQNSRKAQTHIEIERKFLMRRLPIELLKKRKHEVINITQYYFEINGTWQRFRVATSKKATKYIHTIKKSVDVGAELETERQMDKKEFEKIFKQHKSNYRIIEKTRYVIKHKGLKFEIDEYQNLYMVVLEVELPKLNFCFQYPKGLESDIIYELTGLKQFSNLNLALKCSN